MESDSNWLSIRRIISLVLLLLDYDCLVGFMHSLLVVGLYVCSSGAM